MLFRSREATALPDCPEALVANRNFGTTCFYFGDFAGAHDHLQKTIELYDPARHADFANRFGTDPCATAEIIDALTLWVLGRTDEALRLADRALADAESAAHAPDPVSLPARESPNLLAKYRVTTGAVAVSRR